MNSAFFWAYAAWQIPAGGVVDRYGVKRPCALSFLFWCLVSVATALAGSVAVLIALRILLGIGESVVAAASYRWIRLNFAEHPAVGLYMTGTKIGPAIGTPLAAWLIIQHDWQMMFVMVGLGGLVSLIARILLVDNRNRAVLQTAGAIAESRYLLEECWQVRSPGAR
ncbi:MAG: MFS transporter [Candidatus Solibacter sp.]